MDQQLLGGRPLLGVDGEALSNEVVELVGPLVRLCQATRRVLLDYEHRTHWVDVGVGGLALRHLDAGDAQGPDISLFIVQAAGYHLGGHPVGSTDHRVFFREGVS